jgi:D-3-phosphoglycerate dehydrogenase
LKKKVLVTLSFPPSFINGFESCVQILTSKDFEVIIDPRYRPLTTEELVPRLKGVYAHVASAERLTAAVMDQADSLKVISRMGVGYDTVDVPAATERGIALTITPGANADAVAEHTVALLLGLTRKIVQLDSITRKGMWKTVFGTSIYGKTLGILGTGNIGKCVIRNLSGFGMKVLAYDPVRDISFAEKYKVTYCSIEQLFAESDYISVHIPLSEESRGLISVKEFEMMKPTAQIINCARGEIIDEKALVAALKNGTIAGAALDVYEKEPALADNPLFALENVVLSPHIAGMTYEGRKSVVDMAFRNIIDISEGRLPKGLVNPAALESK